MAAGSAYEGEFNDVEKQAESLAASLARDPAGGEAAAYSFPLLSEYGGWPPAAAVMPAAAPWVKPPEKKTAEAKPADKSLAAKTADKPPADKPAEMKSEPQRPYSYRSASAAVWAWLLADSSHVRDLPAALNYLDGAVERPAYDPIEIHFLRMLDAYLDPPLLESGGDRIHRALVARNLAEQAAAPPDARVLYWLQPPMAPADQSRREAEDRLFVGSPRALAQADGLWNGLIGENGQGGTFAATIHRGGEIAAAFQLRDRAWAELPVPRAMDPRQTAERPAQSPLSGHRPKVGRERGRG